MASLSTLPDMTCILPCRIPRSRAEIATHEKNKLLIPRTELEISRNKHLPCIIKNNINYGEIDNLYCKRSKFSLALAAAVDAP